MLPSADNEFLTRVEGDAPMGRMLRDCYWTPAVRAGRVEADGPPIRVRLVGKDYVAFRATDGRVGFLDEACPHRRASLALARNEDCALRCIFHGWKIDVSGKVVETPNEAREPERFAARVKVNHYPIRESCGLIWVYLGSKEEPPPFPEFEFSSLPADQVRIISVDVPCNWIQGVDVSLDEAHVAILHESFIAAYEGSRQPELSIPLSYDIEFKPYGFQATALRNLEEGKTHASSTYFVMPWFGFVSTGAPDDAGFSRRTIHICVPIDDYNYIQFFLTYDLKRPIGNFFGGSTDYDQDNFAPPQGGPETRWGQNREAMKNGHHTGFLSNLTAEDTAVLISMGAISDRPGEHPCSADKAVGFGRRLLIEAARNYQKGEVPPSATPDASWKGIRARIVGVEPTEDWRPLLAPKPRAGTVNATANTSSGH